MSWLPSNKKSVIGVKLRSNNELKEAANEHRGNGKRCKWEEKQRGVNCFRAVL